MAVGDGLRVADEIRGGAPVLARAAEVETKAGAHVVHGEERPVLVAERAEAGEEAGGGRGAGLVVERRRHHHRDLARMLDEERPQLVEIVPRELEQIVAVVGGHSGQVGEGPGARRVIGAARADDARPAGMGAGHVDRPARRVGAVLAEDHQVGAQGERDQALGQLDHARAGQRQAVPRRDLLGDRRLHGGMAVAEDHRAVGAHPVDVLVAVDVPHPPALGAGEEARVVLAKGRAVLVAVDTPRHHAAGALPQGMARSLTGRRGRHGRA